MEKYYHVRRNARCFRLIVLLAFLISALTVQAQSLIKGTVIDATGTPLIGVTVQNTSTKGGTVTDMDGNVTVPAKKGDMLKVSYVGYLTQTLRASSGHMAITLKENVSSLDELVVVGYGVQKKRDIVGAIDKVSGDVVENRANTNITRSLQGQIPGLTITQTDGRSTRGGGIHIRGNVNSIGAGGSALVLIDGVEGSLSQVNPDDVESVSVLKDASSAAVYGARGAFGVILVTTKSARAGRAVVKYSGQISQVKRTVKYDVVTNGLQWTNDFYEAFMGYRGTEPSTINNVFNANARSWSDWYGELQRRDANPLLEKQRTNSRGYYEYFGNTDWLGAIYRDNNFATQHNVSISGGSDRATFYISGRYNGNNGIYKVGNERFNKYNIRAKGMLKLNSWLRLENNTDVFLQDYREPIVMYAYDRNNLDTRIPIQRQIETQGFPVATLRNTDGTWTQAAVYTGFAGFAEGNSWRQNKWANVTNTTTLFGNVIKDVLLAKADFTYKRTHQRREQVGNIYDAMISPTEKWSWANYNYLEHRYYDTEYMAGSATLTYTPKLRGGHYFKGMGGWNLEQEQYRSTRVMRQGLLEPNMPNFNFTDSEAYYINDNGSYDWAFVGLFYRLNYNWKGRYLIETSGRYDGSSKFPTNQKWSFFHSASVGWRVSEEPWMESLRSSFLDNFKLRASIGEAGNGLVAPYEYLSTMSIIRGTSVINGKLANYTQAPAAIPSGLTWEKVITYNFGIDVDMFKNRFTFSFDIYRKNTKDMYVVGDELPAVYGNNPPKGNNADMRTNGWEVSMGWRDRVMVAGSPLNYHLKAALWNANSTITKYTATTNTVTSYYNGKEVGEIWGFDCLGFFQSKDDVLNSPDQSWLHNYNRAGQVWEAGDLKFRDVNDDHKIDIGNNTLENHGDLIKIGNTTPRYCYSISYGADWKGIGLSMFWQGVGKRDWYPNTEAGLFWGNYGRVYGYDLPWHNASNRAGVDADGNITNPNAYWPRLRGYIAEDAKGALARTNNRYLQNAAYLRLKTISLSYSFPQTLISKVGLSNLMVYVSGENLLTITPLHKWAKNFDPEVISAGDASGWNGQKGTAGDGYSYPMLKSLSLGLNITF